MGDELREKQIRRALLRLGVDCEEDAHCALCPESRPEALERHHPAGRVRGVPVTDETVILCANCHRCVSDPRNQRLDGDHPDASFLDGVAELLNERARRLRQPLAQEVAS